MIPAGRFDGAPGAGLGGLGAVKTLLMPADATGLPFGQPGPGIPGDVRQTYLGGAGGAGGAGGLGAAQAADSPVYAAVTVAGAGLGGALLGWVAADSTQGAQRGAAFAAGLTATSTGMATWGNQRTLGAVLVVVGLGGMLWAVRHKIRRR